MRRIALLALAVAWLAAAVPAQAAARDGRLRPVPGLLPEDGAFEVSGTLDGLQLPARPVRSLRITQLIGPTGEGLRPLTRLPALRDLEIEGIAGIDLAPLGELPLDNLVITRGRDLDLAPLGSLGALKRLSLRDLRDCRVPPALALPPTLESLYIANDGFRLTGEPVKALIDAIDWPRLGALRYLGLQVGGLEWLRPIRVDLGLLRHLPRLRQLQMPNGVWHDGSGPSPLTPPFDGLARTLRWVQIDAWHSHAVARALKRRLPGRSVSVSQRLAWKPGGGSWTISHFRDEWITYGSFWDAADGRDGETETQSLTAARRRLRAKDPALLRRLDFDSESSGTGISAPSRRDLVRPLHILGIRY
jgi:hypothetical protein